LFSRHSALGPQGDGSHGVEIGARNVAKEVNLQILKSFRTNKPKNNNYLRKEQGYIEQ
jgi:hypothetical protein